MSQQVQTTETGDVFNVKCIWAPEVSQRYCNYEYITIVLRPLYRWTCISQHLFRSELIVKSQRNYWSSFSTIRRQQLAIHLHAVPFLNASAEKLMRKMDIYAMCVTVAGTHENESKTAICQLPAVVAHKSDVFISKHSAYQGLHIHSCRILNNQQTDFHQVITLTHGLSFGMAESVPGKKTES